MHLEDLVPELLAQILESLDDLQDFLSLIGASPQCFRVYVQSPSLVLTPVIQNAIQPIALQHAIACEYFPSDASSQTAIRQQYLRDYFHGSKPLEFPTDETAITALCGLCIRTSYFVDDYAARAIRALRLRSEGNQGTTLDLSSTELARLQRAFFRYELYCRAFPINRRARDRSLVPAREQFTEFIARIPPWEAEEMICVHHYFTGLIGRYFDDLEDELVEAVHTTPGVRLPPPAVTRSSSQERVKRRKISVARSNDSLMRDEPYESEPNDGDEGRTDHDPVGQTDLRLFKNLELYGLTMFSKDSMYEPSTNISYIASLGSTFMYRLVRANKDQRRRLIRENTPAERDFLPEALAYAPHTSPQIILSEGTKEDNPLRSSLGWDRFKCSTQEVYSRIIDDFSGCPLRERAYVFWDTNRIICPLVNGQLQIAKDMDPDKTALRFNRDLRTTVEERLKGVGIPQDQMKRIIEEYRSLFQYDDGSK